MKVALRELNPTLTVTLTGNEPWLAKGLYQDFQPSPGSTAEPRNLTGSLELRLEEGGTVLVRGDLAYTPVVPCSRCDLALAWPLTMQVHTRFYPPPEFGSVPKERSLTESELDAYEIHNDSVDLEQLIIDTVHTSLPDRILPAPAKDGKSCGVCLTDLSADLVYGKELKQEKESPFSALKGLKLPQ